MLIGVLECEDLELWRSKGGHAAFFERALRLAPAAADATAERWVKFEVTRGQLPDADDLRRFDAFIITGSHHSAYDDTLPWREALFAFIREFVATAEQHKAKLFGACFGCQIIAEALGGKVSRNPCQRFLLGVETIEPNAAFAEVEFVQRAIAAAASEREREALQQLARHRFRALESHGDCVSTLPPGAVNLAASEHTVNEIYMIGSKLLAVQFHPEFNIDDVRTIIAPAVEERGVMDEAQLAATMASFERGVDNDMFRLLINTFMRSSSS